MRDDNSRMRFSHADDVGILVMGKRIVESAALAQREVDEFLS